MELPPDETDALVFSIQKYMNEEFDEDVSAMKAKFLLEYMWKEIAPFAYNAGVKDADEYMRAKVEELPSICFRDGLTYWRGR